MSALKKACSRVGRSRVMFTEVASVAVLVHDAGKAAEWYRQKLGFEVSVQGHWVTAKPPASSVVPSIVNGIPQLLQLLAVIALFALQRGH